MLISSRCCKRELTPRAVKLALLVTCSIITHQLRDSRRHGMWFYLNWNSAPITASSFAAWVVLLSGRFVKIYYSLS